MATTISQQIQLNGRVGHVKVTRSDTSDELDYVLKSDIEEHFKIILDTDSLRFTCNDVAFTYASGADLNLIIPHRIEYHPDAMVVITQSERVENSNQTFSFVSSLQTVNTLPAAASVLLAPTVDTAASQEVIVPNVAVEDGNLVLAIMNLATNEVDGTVAGKTEYAHEVKNIQTFHSSSSTSPSSSSTLRAPQEHPARFYAANTVINAFREYPTEAIRSASLVMTAQVIFGQRFESYESPRPRLFTILPNPSKVWNAEEILDNSFVIYFLCECGQDDKLFSTHLNHKHHPGFEVCQPRSFFDLFGSYLLVVLEILRLGIPVGGHQLEPLSPKKDAELLRDIDRTVQYLEKLWERKLQRDVVGLARESFESTRKWQEFMISAEKVDLSKVIEYVKDEGNMMDSAKGFGQLFRIRDESTFRVKWVCQQHFRPLLTASEVEMTNLDLFLSNPNGGAGSFDWHCGLVKASPNSMTAANKLYEIIQRVTHVQELDLTFNWNHSYDHLLRLQSMICSSRISKLILDLNNHTGPSYDLDFQGHFNPLFAIMRHPSIRSVSLQQVNGLWKRCENNGPPLYPNLRELCTVWPPMKRPDIQGMLDIIEGAENLEKLHLTVSHGSADTHAILIGVILRSRGVNHCRTEFTCQPNISVPCEFAPLKLILPNIGDKENKNPVIYDGTRIDDEIYKYMAMTASGRAVPVAETPCEICGVRFSKDTTKGLSTKRFTKQEYAQYQVQAEAEQADDQAEP